MLFVVVGIYENLRMCINEIPAGHSAIGIYLFLVVVFCSEGEEKDRQIKVMKLFVVKSKRKTKQRLRI